MIDGSPHLDCEFNFRDGDDHLAGGFNITAMRAVNAIPALCEADPGVVSTFDLPPVTGRGRCVEVAPSPCNVGPVTHRHFADGSDTLARATGVMTSASAHV